MFSVHTKEEFKNATTGLFYLSLRKSRAARKSHDCRGVNVSEKLRFRNVFCPQENEKPAFLNCSGLATFRDGLVWTVDLIGEIKLRFQVRMLPVLLNTRYKNPQLVTQHCFVASFRSTFRVCHLVRSTCGATETFSN